MDEIKPLTDEEIERIQISGGIWPLNLEQKRFKKL